jgi:hypothetical protein
MLHGVTCSIVALPSICHCLAMAASLILHVTIYRATGHTQKNGEVSKVIKKCISHPTQAQHTLQAAGLSKFLKC